MLIIQKKGIILENLLVEFFSQEPWQLHWWKFARGPNFEGLHASQRSKVIDLDLYISGSLFILKSLPLKCF
jgi:hypothetical protein